MPLSRDEAVALLDDWRDLENAILQISCSLPSQIGERVAALEAETKEFARHLIKVAMESEP